MSSSTTQDQKAIIVADLTFGDAGKGSVIDFLARRYQADIMIRYNGGAQAAHNVLTPSGQHHTFAQFGSGMFVPDTQTLLSRFMLLDPLAMLNEAEHLGSLGVDNVFERTTIDHRALVITPYHQAANRLKEMARGDDRHGSCGMGIGETVSDHLKYGEKMLFVGDLIDENITAKKLGFIRQQKCQEIEALQGQIPHSEQAQEALNVFDDPDLIEACSEVYAYFADLVTIADASGIKAKLESAQTLLFEGAQGVLLDEDFGFHPHTTWSKTTFRNADTLLDDIGYAGRVIKVGVTRTYTTRHGAGPLVTEDQSPMIPDSHNVTNEWQHDFRVGYLDLIALRYAIEVAGTVDCLALTHLDRLDEFPRWQVCDGYEYQGNESDLSPYFEHDGRMIRSIKVNNPPTLEHQERLTQLLGDCVPCYTTIEKSPEHYLAKIEARLGVLIGLTSGGMTADDKQFTAFWHEQF